MIDSGSAEDAPLLENDLHDRKINPDWIRAIVLTHGHWDHAGGARYFQDKYKTPVLLGAQDSRLLTTNSKNKRKQKSRRNPAASTERVSHGRKPFFAPVFLRSAELTNRLKQNQDTLQRKSRQLRFTVKNYNLRIFHRTDFSLSGVLSLS